MEGSLVTINPADIGLLFPAVVTLCLLFISGLVSGAEISFFSLTPHDLQNIKAHPERPSNSAILNLLSNVDQLLATILVVNNLVNICIVLLAAKIINTLFSFGSAGMQFLFESVIATFLLLLFGEIIPKVFAQSRPLRFARWVARIILLFRRLVRPVSYVLIRTGSSISEHAVRKSEISLDELADAVDMTSTTSAEEHNMLSGIVKFANTEVQEIMRPRMDVVAVAVGEAVDEHLVGEPCPLDVVPGVGLCHNAFASGRCVAALRDGQRHRLASRGREGERYAALLAFVGLDGDVERSRSASRSQFGRAPCALLRLREVPRAGRGSELHESAVRRGVKFYLVGRYRQKRCFRTGGFVVAAGSEA